MPNRGQHVVKSFRVPVELAVRIDEARGTIPESVWLRDTLAELLITAEERALLEIRDMMQRRGISPRRLVAWLQLEESGGNKVTP
jgi:hypothetical protein